MLKDKRVRCGQIRDLLMQLCVNQVDKEGVREEDSCQVVGVIRVEVRVVKEGIQSSKKFSWDMNNLEVKVSEV